MEILNFTASSISLETILKDYRKLLESIKDTYNWDTDGEYYILDLGHYAFKVDTDNTNMEFFAELGKNKPALIYTTDTSLFTPVKEIIKEVHFMCKENPTVLLHELIHIRQKYAETSSPLDVESLLDYIKHPNELEAVAGEVAYACKYLAKSKKNKSVGLDEHILSLDAKILPYSHSELEKIFNDSKLGAKFLQRIQEFL